MINPYESPRSDEQRRQEGSCSFCERSYRDVGPLVEGPDLAYICGECCDIVIAAHAEPDQPGMPGQCSFCQNEAAVAGLLITAASGVQICAECADLVRDMIDQELLRRLRGER